MRLDEILKLFEAPEDGTFAGVHFDDHSVNALQQFVDDNQIPNQTPPDKYHATLLFSKVPIKGYEPHGAYKQALTATPKDVTIFGEGDEKALVIVLNAPELVKRHKYLMNKHPEATWDYDEYIPHVTLSYNAGDFNIGTLNVADIGPLSIIEEYGADIEPDWEKNLD